MTERYPDALRRGVSFDLQFAFYNLHFRSCYNAPMFKVLKKAAEEGAKIQMQYFGKKHLHETTNKKSNQDVVTIADKESQNVIEKTIIEQMIAQGYKSSQIGFIGEEDLRVEGEHTFVIDPIDGTSNFSVGLNEFALMIAYFKKDKLTANLIYFPTKNHWYFAEIGKGAWMEKNGVKTEIKKEELPLKDTVLMSSLSYDTDFQFKTDVIVKNLYSQFRAVRMYGCAGTELVLLAEHIGGLVFSAGTSIWDISPAKLIIEEAGFQMYNPDGTDLVFDLTNPRRKYPFIACLPKYKDQIIEVVESVMS